MDEITVQRPSTSDDTAMSSSEMIHGPEFLSTILDAQVLECAVVEIMEDDEESIHESAKRCKWKSPQLVRFLAVCGILLTVLCVVGIAVVLFSQPWNEGTSPSSSPATTTSNGVLLEYYSELHHTLKALGVKGLQDPSTAAFEALEWISFEDGAVQQLALDDISAIQQRFAVAELFFSTAGADFWGDEWLVPGVSECRMSGLACNEHAQVINLDLSQRSLIGTIPDTLTWLSHLEQLLVPRNRLYGSLPGTLFAKLTSLELLNLSYNRLSGSLPRSLVHLSNLYVVDLQSNSFSGSLPIALPPNLRLLLAGTNAFAGAIPFADWISNVQGGVHPMSLLDLGENDVGGTIPSELAIHFPRLKSLDMYETNLSGSIPSEFGTLELEELSLAQVQLTGTIPPELFRISTLQFLDIVGSDVHGSLPTEVGLLTNLEALNLMHTNMNGTIPTEIGYLTDLEWLLLASTAISGTIPTELGELKKLLRVWLEGTNLSGSLPQQLCETFSTQGSLQLGCAIDTSTEQRQQCAQSCFNSP
eukprot:Nitzschia sp. Nitz4//scaffold85_size83877//45488//47165//NITZ4_005232-RA/size83877-augustus-gene-0.162-mRNA-1//-1//CDS//3329559146//1391//frame0